MRRLTAIAALPFAILLAACAGSGKPNLAACADSWNSSGDHTTLATMAQGGELGVRLSRFDSGECALTYNSGGVIGALVVRDGRWQDYAGATPGSIGEAGGMIAEMQRLVGYIYEAGREEPNVMPGVAGTVQPMKGKRIGRLATSL
jgi:hypothetical protein